MTENQANLERLARRLEAISTRLPRTIAAELEETGAEAVALAQDTVGGDRLNVRTGHLRRSIQHEVSLETGAVLLQLRAGGGANDVRYAAIHEYGGDIVGHPFLAIPVHPSLRTKAGATSARGLGGPRSIPDSFFYRSHTGKLFLATRAPGRGKGLGRIVNWYLMVHSVHIHETRFMRDARDQAQSGLGDRLAQRVIRLVGAA